MALLATGASSAAVDLNSDDFFSLWSFLTISYDELNALTFSKSLVTRALNCTEMCKYVRAAFTFDEAEAFVFVKPFHCTSNFIGHFCYLKLKLLKSCQAGVVLEIRRTYKLQDEVLLGRLRNGENKYGLTFKLRAVYR